MSVFTNLFSHNHVWIMTVSLAPIRSSTMIYRPYSLAPYLNKHEDFKSCPWLPVGRSIKNINSAPCLPIRTTRMTNNQAPHCRMFTSLASRLHLDTKKASSTSRRASFQQVGASADACLEMIWKTLLLCFKSEMTGCLQS